MTNVAHAHQAPQVPVNQGYAALIFVGGAVAAAFMVMAALIAMSEDTPTVGLAQRAAPATTAQIAVRFEDRGDGAVAVYRQGETTAFKVIAPGTAHFLRATVRGLASERKRRHLDDTTPFEVTTWSDGRVTLDDPATARHIELDAFGATNSEAFAGLVRAAAASPAETGAKP